MRRRLEEPHWCQASRVWSMVWQSCCLTACKLQPYRLTVAWLLRSIHSSKCFSCPHLQTATGNDKLQKLTFFCFKSIQNWKWISKVSLHTVLYLLVAKNDAEFSPSAMYVNKFKKNVRLHFKENTLFWVNSAVIEFVLNREEKKVLITLLIHAQQFISDDYISLFFFFFFFISDFIQFFSPNLVANHTHISSITPHAIRSTAYTWCLVATVGSSDPILSPSPSCNWVVVHTYKVTFPWILTFHSFGARMFCKVATQAI